MTAENRPDPSHADTIARGSGLAMRAVISSVCASGTFHSSNCQLPLIKPDTSASSSTWPAGGRIAMRASIAARAFSAPSRASMIRSSDCSRSAMSRSSCQIDTLSARTPTSSAHTTAVPIPTAASASIPP